MACTFSVILPAGQRRAVEAGCAALDEIERLEEKLSAYRADSDISRINRWAWEGPVAVDEEVFALCETSARLNQATEGAFDIAAGALSKAWGFYRGPKRVPEEAELRTALAASGMAQVELDPVSRVVHFRRRGIELNLGSIGKGYAIDLALARIRAEYGTASVLMQGGQSSLKAAGSPPGEAHGWTVAIGDPYRPTRTVAAVRLKDRALGTSGAAHQYFIAGGRRYGHVLDPRTGWPADRVASASAIAPTAAEADALSTAFFVLGVEFARRYCREHKGTGAVLVTKATAGKHPEVIAIGLDHSEVVLGPAQIPDQRQEVLS